MVGIISKESEVSKRNPDVSISWNVRSLKEFGDMPIEYLIEQYDLITIGHPYMGQAHKNQLLLSVDDYISADDLSRLEKLDIGQW